MTPYTAWPVKIAYICLVLWTAVISPLIYFGDYSSHKGVGGYELNVWQKSNQAYKLNQALAQIAAQTQSVEQRAAHYLRHNMIISAANQALNTTGQKLSYQDYLVIVIAAPVLVIFLLYRRVLAHITGGQAELPPPKHPPSLLLGF